MHALIIDASYLIATTILEKLFDFRTQAIYYVCEWYVQHI